MTSIIVLPSKEIVTALV